MGGDVHIYVATGTRFTAQVRRHGCRKWESVGPDRKAHETAIKDMTRAFCAGRYKRGRVLLVADWYDPVVITEMNARS